MIYIIRQSLDADQDRVRYQLFLRLQRLLNDVVWTRNLIIAEALGNSGLVSIPGGQSSAYKRKVYIGDALSRWLRPFSPQIETGPGLDDMALQWCHDECDGVSNHRRLDCLLSRLFKRRSKKTSKLPVTGLCEGNSPVTGEFPSQRTSNTENGSIWWRHHGTNSFSQYLHDHWPHHPLVPKTHTHPKLR